MSTHKKLNIKYSLRHPRLTLGWIFSITILTHFYPRPTTSACVESFSGTLKRELVYHRRYAPRDEATQDSFEYIDVFYNRKRRHSTLGYHSPAEYDARPAVA